jgi:uncharacterized protein (DUF1800 family)
MPIFSAIALNRFGLGARPGEMSSIGSDPRGWLLQQMKTAITLPPAMRGLPSTTDARKLFKDMKMEKKERRKQAGEEAKGDNDIQKLVRAEAKAKIETGITTNAPFYERLVSFWANHFTVSGTKGQVTSLAGAYEREAIRPYVFSSFREMVRAAALHPAMLIYLDNNASIGPNSQAAMRIQKRNDKSENVKKRGTGLNENLAREVLELHTLGVNGGYTQADVTNFAMALTGWSPAGMEETNQIFFPLRHEPGAQVILGRSFPQSGQEQALAVLDALSVHPATARHVCTKLARHFIADDPPNSAISKLEQVFLRSGGNLAEVMQALVMMEESWQEPLSKFKRPDEFLISIGRAMNDASIGGDKVIAFLDRLGMRMFFAPSPQGWPDKAADWAGSDALWKRIEIANLYASRAGNRVDARTLMKDVIGPVLSTNTQFIIEGAESPEQALALLFVSPEFLRR